MCSQADLRIRGKKSSLSAAVFLSQISVYFTTRRLEVHDVLSKKKA